MKQYDIIFVPSSAGSYEVVKLASECPTDGETYAAKKDVIVLTVDELKSIWKYATNRAMGMVAGGIPAETFETYLKTKGIVI